MACCAFAAFIFGQILFGYERFKTWLGFRTADAGARLNATVAWSPDAPALVAPPSKRIRSRWLRFGAATLAIEVLLLAVAGTALAAHRSESAEAATLSSLLSFVCNGGAVHAPSP